MAKIVVTGGAGFIGSHIVDALIGDGHAVTVLDNLSSGSKDNLNSRAEFVQLDIRSKEARQLLENERPDVLVHEIY